MSMINCPECGKEISDQAEKCINCGYPIQNFIKRKEKENFINNEKIKFAKCRNCNTQNEADSSFCVGCGKKLRKVFVTVDTLMSKPMQELSKYYCKNCNSQNDYGIKTCQACGNQLITPSQHQQVKPQYRPIANRNGQIIRCKMCKSDHIQFSHQETVVTRQAKTVKAVTPNLNIFHPLTMVNIKERTIKPEQTMKVQYYVCCECGYTFK